MAPSSHVTLALLTLGLCHLMCSALVVRAPWGSIQGTEIEGQGGRRLSAYLGIPFALPPTGQLRWQKPQPHPGPGNGQVFVADTFKPACPQELMLGIFGDMSEDCLTLNVFTPVGADSVTSPFAVMIFIHGGGFIAGEAPPYRPTRLVSDGGVIVVTIQYRLGTLGFLTTGDDLVLGNFGLWDQTLAIRWVKDNIRAFNGDPEVITIFGESAGSMSVGIQTISPKSKGLFQRAVLQSGTPNVFSCFISRKDERKSFLDFSKELDCEADTKIEMLGCLRTKSFEDIMNATTVLCQKTSNTVLFLPRVDGDFIPREPLELLKDEQYVKDVGLGDIDIVVGANNKEGSLVWLMLILTGQPLEAVVSPAFFDTMLRTVLKFHVAREQRDNLNDVVIKVAEFFYRRADAGTNTSVPLKTVTDMVGDAEFLAPSVAWMRGLVSQPNAGSRFLYLFDHDFSFNKQGLIPGSHHGDELFTEFDFNEVGSMSELFKKLNKSGLSEEDEPLSAMFVQMITDFAKTGNPNAPLLKTALGGDWSEFKVDDEAYLSVSLTPRVERGLLRDRMAIWLNLVPQISSALQQRQEEQPEAPIGKDEL